MHRGGKRIQVEGTECTKACGEEVAQSGRISGSQSSGALEAFEGSVTPPPAACAPGLCSDSGHGSQMGLAARGAGCLQPALPPATTHQPSPWLAGTASPGSPHSTQLPQPLFSPVSCPSLFLSSLQLFLWQSLSHSGEQPQPARSSGQTEVFPGGFKGSGGVVL